MMTGYVNARYEIIVPLPVRNAASQEQPIETILDSGFTGSLTLPPAVIASLGLPYRSRSRVLLANGSVQPFDVYVATVVWDGTPRQILVQEIDTSPLLDMRLLVGYDLRARVRIGGAVEIEAVP